MNADANYRTRSVHFLLEQYKLTAIQSTIFLYDILVQTNASSDALAAEITPCLVTLLKHDRNGLFLVEQQFIKYIVLEHANFYDVDADQRGHAIEQYLLSRRDVSQTKQMLTLWAVCMHLAAIAPKNSVVTLERMCDVCINPHLISKLVQLPDAVQLVRKEHVRLDTHVPTVFL
jgi:hypothetical protein